MKVVYTSILVVLAISLDVASDPDPERFEFEQTVAIYHLVKDGGVIYSRPEEYNEAQGFLRIYEAIDQYLIELDMPGSSVLFDIEQQTKLDELVLVNAIATKSYLLKDHWFGDGEKWVPMSRHDYEKLRSIIDERKVLAGSTTTAEGLKDFTGRIHEAGKQNEIPKLATRFQQADQQQVVGASRSKSQVTIHPPESADATSVRADVRLQRTVATRIGVAPIAKELPTTSTDKFQDDVGQHEKLPAQEMIIQDKSIEEMVSPSN